MAPTTKAGTAKPLLGQPDSVLSPEFLLAVQENRPCDDILPFARPLQAQLPSIEQVLKLYYFLREMVGKTNKHVSNFDVSKQVSTYVAMYWRMAGFKTLVFFRIVGHVQKLVDAHQKIVRHISSRACHHRKKIPIFLGGVFFGCHYA